MKQFLIMLEQTEAGFAVQVPDLAITTCGDTIESAKEAARAAVRVSLDAYGEAGMAVPDPTPVSRHLENPDFKDLLFAYVDLSNPKDRIAA
jgi:predicted RNase H-like HicB family nuclease